MRYVDIYSAFGVNSKGSHVCLRLKSRQTLKATIASGWARLFGWHGVDQSQWTGRDPASIGWLLGNFRFYEDLGTTRGTLLDATVTVELVCACGFCLLETLPFGLNLEPFIISTAKPKVNYPSSFNILFSTSLISELQPKIFIFFPLHTFRSCMPPCSF